MELYLIRHGIAQEREANIKDEERCLTKEGRMKTEKVANRLLELGLHFDLIASSPLVRAVQTAEILIGTGLSTQFEECAHLAPEGNIHNWLVQWFELHNFSKTTQLALVGHEPCLSNWAGILMEGEASSGFVLKKAGMIGLKLPDDGKPLGRSQMFWLTPPKYLL